MVCRYRGIMYCACVERVGIVCDECCELSVFVVGVMVGV